MIYETLAAAGLNPVDHRVVSWRGSFAPVGVLLHHTASPRYSGDLPSLRVCQMGRRDVKGPLCQVLIGRDATVAVITDGRANHAGEGAWPGITSGNGQLVGVEIENDGVGEPWSIGVLGVTAHVTAALARRFGPLVIGHKEWAPRRKIDPTFDMDAMRAAVTSINAPPPPPPAPPIIDYGAIDMDKVQTKLVPIGPLGGDGNGWTFVRFDEPITRVIGVTPHGPFPPSDGYWPIPRNVSAQVRGADVVVTVNGGWPRSTVNVWVSAA